jgi:uncharacterized protein (TIGR03435 family)
MASFGARPFARKPAKILVALLLASIFAAARAQAPAAAPMPAGQPPAFATASIKPIDDTPGAAHVIGAKVFPGGRVVITTYSLKGLIGIAFHIGAWQITGGDPWTDDDEYDFEGKPAEASPPATYDLRYSTFGLEDEHLRQMLQTFLIERFHLKFHRDSKNGTIYLLEKSGKPITLVSTQLKLAKYYGEGFSGNFGHASHWTLYNTSMSQLASFLSDTVFQHPVLDRTGLDGYYDFESKITESDADAQRPVEETFPRVVQEMGLSLKKSSGPVETFVIDHADNPFPN